jgi:predicted metal-binding protein
MVAENTIPLSYDKSWSYLPRHKPFLETPALEERIFTLCQHLGIEGIHLIKTSQIIVAQWVRLKCRYGCDNYNTNWCCPPATVTVKEAKEILREYKSALLLCGEADHPHFYTNISKKRRKQVEFWKSTIAIERELFLLVYHKAFGLTSESCALCKKCAYPENCLFPKEKRPSVESFSIDIFQTLQRIGKETKIAQKIEDHYNHYSIILLE